VEGVLVELGEVFCIECDLKDTSVRAKSMGSEIFACLLGSGKRKLGQLWLHVQMRVIDSALVESQPPF